MMKKIILSVITILLFVSCRVNNDIKDKKALHNWILDYQGAVWNADVEKLLSFVINTVVYLPPNEPAFSGIENLRKWYLDYFNYYHPSEVLGIQDLEINGDLACMLCDYSVSAKENHSGKEFIDDGKLVNIFKRQANGEWKIIYSIWNSNHQVKDLHSQIPADFSGTWRLDLSRSTVLPDLISSTMFIVQKGDEISLNQTTELKDKGPFKNTVSYTIGTEIENVAGRELSKTSSYWSPDKHSFTIINELHSNKSGKEHEYKRTTSYSITARGETLNIVSDDTLPSGAFSATKDKHIEMVFNKESK